MERPDLIILDQPEPAATPGRPRQVPLWAIMVAVVAVALTLALVRGWELGCGLVAAWGAVLLALIEGIARTTGRSRARGAAIASIGYPWLALATVVGLITVRESSEPGPLLAEALTILVRVVLIGVPVALLANYYLVLAEACPRDAPAGPGPGVPPPGLHALVAASLASWASSLVVLVAGLALTA